MIMLKYPSTVSCMALWSILSMQITYEIQKTDSKRRKVISRSNIFYYNEWLLNRIRGGKSTYQGTSAKFKKGIT